jgi:hypothetical protein
MAFKLTKAERTELADLLGKVVDAAVALNAARTDFEAFREGVHARLESEFDERSEGWQESERGEAAETFRDEWEREICDEADEAPEDYPEESEAG